MFTFTFDLHLDSFTSHLHLFSLVLSGSPWSSHGCDSLVPSPALSDHRRSPGRDPAGGLVSILVCGQWRETVSYSEFGLSKVIGVSILLIGTGTVAGIVKGSGLNGDMIRFLNACHLPVFALAPLSSILLSGATASTTAGVTIAAQTFSATLLQAGVPAVSAAAMLHAGGTIFDALPHGSFFHATAGAVGMSVKDRLKLFPLGTLVGATTTVTSVLVYLLFR